MKFDFDFEDWGEYPGGLGRMGRYFLSDVPVVLGDCDRVEVDEEDLLLDLDRSEESEVVAGVFDWESFGILSKKFTIGVIELFSEGRFGFSVVLLFSCLCVDVLRESVGLC